MYEILKWILINDLMLRNAVQAGTEWRKAVKKLEGEDAFEALDKTDRLEVFQVRYGI